MTEAGRALAALCLAGMLTASTAAAEPPGEPSGELKQRLGAGDPVAGKIKSEAELCQGCHGADGNAGAVGVPKLSGQYAAYLIKELADFRSQARRHRVMNAMADGPSEGDLQDIAAYYASLPRLTEEETSAAPSAAARELFLYGDVERGIDACSSCHGLDGKGRLARELAYPALAGQHEGYLRVQLLNWKIGARGNSPGGVMNRIAQALSEAEISALSAFLAGM
jgi:cytochrome c553